jgi:hypothetical protein
MNNGVRIEVGIFCKSVVISVWKDIA